MNNKMVDLRNHLFMAIERLNAEGAPPSAEEITRARTVSELCKTLIDSARVEVDCMKVQSEFSNAAPRSDFIEGTPAKALTNGARTQ